jgi:2-dehydropantoate 2-reductase
MMEDEEMRYLILGAGGIGGYFGGMLLRGGADLSFLVRPKRAAQLAERGLVVKAPSGDIKCPVRTMLSGEVDGHYDVVLLACKAYDIKSAMEAIAPALGSGSVILPFQNGINHISILVDRFGPQRVLGGKTFANCWLSPEGDIIRRAGGPDQTSFGELTGERSTRCEVIQRALAEGGAASTVSENIIAELWAKFYAVAVVATIAALSRAPAGEIAATSSGAAFVASVFDECTRVTHAEGHTAPSDIKERVSGHFARIGSPYRPSILDDLEAGRRTEGEHTIGDLVRRADLRGVAVPILRAALCNVQVHESRVRI